MTPFRLSPATEARLDEIYDYTCETRDAQADRYIRGLFDAFARIAWRAKPSGCIPAEFGHDGWHAPATNPGGFIARSA